MTLPTKNLTNNFSGNYLHITCEINLLPFINLADEFTKNPVINMKFAGYTWI